ncbi:MAG: hypothetical protein WAM14_16330 [Candidatus Nitrosopolaris sp.]
MEKISETTNTIHSTNISAKTGENIPSLTELQSTSEISKHLLLDAKTRTAGELPFI